MLRYIELGEYVINMRDVMTYLGSAIAIVVVAYLLYRRFVKESGGGKRILCYFLVPIVWQVIVVFTAGSFLGKIMRGMTFSLTGTLWERFVYIYQNAGNHFLGTVLASGILLPPILRFFLGKDTEAVLGNIDFFYTIQHIFNRIGCFMQGCCYGIPMSGFLSVKFPSEILSHTVFSSQLFEAFCMVVLLVLQIVAYRRGKDIFRMTMIGFGISIFISEFFMDQSGTVLYLQLSAIQYFALILCVGAWIVPDITRIGKREKNKVTQ